MIRSLRILPLICALTTFVSYTNRSTVCYAVDSVDHRVTVDLSNGRSRTGVIDASTSEKLLRLGYSSPGIVLLMSIDWDEVIGAHYKDRPISGKELRQLSNDLKPQLRELSSVDIESSKGMTKTAHPTRRQAKQAVRSLHIEAAVANWDHDVEVDGVELHIVPQDGRRQVIPVEGTLFLRLIAQQKYDDRQRNPAQKAYTNIGVWSQRVQLTDFGSYGATFQLPFRGIHPEFDLNIHVYGQLNAKFSVPGKGMFEASTDVRLRPFSPVRNELQLHKRHRFFSDERTER